MPGWKTSRVYIFDDSGASTSRNGTTEWLIKGQLVHFDAAVRAVRHKLQGGRFA